MYGFALERWFLFLKLRIRKVVELAAFTPHKF